MSLRNRMFHNNHYRSQLSLVNTTHFRKIHLNIRARDSSLV